jgi:hypothetical protein
LAGDANYLIIRRTAVFAGSSSSNTAYKLSTIWKNIVLAVVGYKTPVSGLEISISALTPSSCTSLSEQAKIFMISGTKCLLSNSTELAVEILAGDFSNLLKM